MPIAMCLAFFLQPLAAIINRRDYVWKLTSLSNGIARKQFQAFTLIALAKVNESNVQ